MLCDNSSVDPPRAKSNGGGGPFAPGAIVARVCRRFHSIRVQICRAAGRYKQSVTIIISWRGGPVMMAPVFRMKYRTNWLHYFLSVTLLASWLPCRGEA